jgi:N-sulfoglucosamine sulfohydrolase
VLVPSYLPDTPVCPAELAEYYQAVSRLDEGVGRLIAILKAAGRYESTLIIYLSDNGAAFPGAKTTLYEPGIRLPCIVRSPGRQHPGSVQSAMITWADLTPTLLDVAGVAVYAGDFDGRSCRAGLDGDELPGWDTIFASHTFHEVTMYYPMRVVRTRRYKLIANLADALAFPLTLDLLKAPTWIDVVDSGGGVFGRRSIDRYLRRPRIELYDLERGPDELINLAEAPDHRKLQAGLIEKLQAFQTATSDPWHHKWDYE